MKRFFGLFFVLSVTFACADPAPHQAPGMAPQPRPSFSGGGQNQPSLIEWQGVPQRTYLLQWSTDMLDWQNFPLTEEGAGAKSFGAFSSTEKLFTRLHYSDETPDRATTADWLPPVLRVAGPWTVKLIDASGAPAAGVPLSFFRWYAGEPSPQPYHFLQAISCQDGTCTIDPQSFSPAFVQGDRVEVRLSGSPNQRVYLPWRAGTVNGDATINPGGNGLAIGDIEADPGELDILWEEIPPEMINEPIYRFADFLTASWGDGSINYVQYPLIATRELVEQTNHPFLNNGKRDSIDDEKTWHWYAHYISDMGHATLNVTEQDTFVEELAYQLKLSLAFGDPALERPVQRNVLIQPLWKSDGVVSVTGTIPQIHPATGGGNPPFLFKDGVISAMGSQQFPHEMFWDDEAWPNYQYSRHLVLGPVPAHVPKSVMGGKAFFYNKLNDVKLFSELPLGCMFRSEFYDEDNNLIAAHPVKIEWTATVTGTNDLHVTIADSTQTSQAAMPGVLLSGSEIPEILLTFSEANEEAPDFEGSFSVTVLAKARVITSADGLQHTEYNLGQFTTDFVHTPIPNASSLRFAARQAAELRGLGGQHPEGDALLGGQRQKTLEPERKIGVTGLPAPGANTFVDALTGRFHHSETDFALSIPGSDLTLAVTRRSTDTIWSDAFHLSPAENPLLSFGPGWDSNLSAALVRVLSLMPDGSETTAPAGNPRRLISTITVRDAQGRPFTFLEYTNGENQTTFLPDPTLIPGRDTTNISLSRAIDGSYTFTQPLLGFTHTYGTSTKNIRIPNNRDTAMVDNIQPGGFTRNHYHRLTHVTDRFGITLLYTYPADANALLPEQIHVEGRPDLRLRFRQENGRITAFWDPSGIKHTYTHQTQNLAPSGQPAALHNVLTSHTIGSRLDASYGYHYALEADPRPDEMLAPLANSTALYRIPTHHITPSAITHGNQETLTIDYTISNVRHVWSAAAQEYYHPAGDPLIVDSIILPNAAVVDFTLDHTLKNGRPAREEIPAIPADYHITTHVTDHYGSHWTYQYSTPNNYAWSLPTADAPHLPSASALFFPSLTRTCDDVADSAVTFHYSANAGFALTTSTDAANRNTSASFSWPCTPSNTLYTRPTASGAIPLHAYYPIPTATANILGHATSYGYRTSTNPLLHLLPQTITDHRQRRITLTHDSLARQTSLTLHDGENTLLSQVDHAHTNTTFPGVLTRITRKALNTNNDPEWVTDLITDIEHDTLGFPEKIGNDAASLHIQLTHSPSGLILEKTASTGGTTTFSFDDAAQLTTTTLADGATYHYQYDPAGRLSLTRDPLGNASAHQYDTLGRITATIRDLNGDLSYSPTNGITGIQPGEDIVRTTQYLDATRTTRHTDPRGYITERRFDPLGRLTTHIAPAPETEPSTIPTPQNDHLTTYHYDLLQSPTQPVKITDPLGYETHYHFDESARLEVILREYATDGTTKLHSGITYDFSPTTGLPTSLTTYRSPFDQAGNILDPFADTLTQEITYDSLDRPYQTTHAAGTDKEQITRRHYTSTGLPYLTEILESLTPSPVWAAYTTEYDSLARPTKQTLPPVTDARTNTTAHPTTQLHYNSSGQLDSTQDAYGHHTHFGYDILGRLAWEKQPAVLDARSGQTSRPTTIYQYDPRGLPIKTIDPLGYAWQTHYDAAHRITETVSPILRPELPAAQQRAITHYHYDPASNLTQLTNAKGDTTTHTYYPNRTLATTTTHASLSATATAPEELTTSYHYNPLGLLTQLIDPADQITTYQRDGLGRITNTTLDAQDPSRQKATTTEYDALLPTAHIDPANIRREYIYNQQLRLAELHIIGQSQENLRYTRDLQGRITEISPLITADPSLTTSFTFDILGRLTSETSNTLTTQYAYDLLHQLTKTTHPHSQTTNTYDPAQRLTSSTTSYPLITDHSALTTSYTHNLRGETIHQHLPNGLTQTNTLDPAGRLTAQTITPAHSATKLTRTEYQYDHLSNLTRLHETFAPGLNIPSRTLENTYNQRSQLLTENQQETGGPLGPTTRTRSETHTYDPAENRLSTHITQVDPTTGTTNIERLFTYGNPTNGLNANQLHTLTETANNGTPSVTQFSYDDNGNRLTKTIGDDTDHYHYDSFNRLTQLEINTANLPAENGIYHYRYDPLTRRISRSIGETPTNTNTTNFAFSGSSPIHQWEGSATQPTWTHHRTGNLHTATSSPLLTAHSSLTTQDIKNVRHDITAQFTENGTLQWHGQYASNGMLLRQYGSKTSTYGANGKYEEPNGLLNEGHRYRDRTTNTFITRDPLGYIDGPNNYNYVKQNPWSAWDPNGLATVLASTTTDIGFATPIENASSFSTNFTHEYQPPMAENPFTVPDDIIYQVWSEQQAATNAQARLDYSSTVLKLWDQYALNRMAEAGGDLSKVPTLKEQQQFLGYFLHQTTLAGQQDRYQQIYGKEWKAHENGGNEYPFGIYNVEELAKELHKIGGDARSAELYVAGLDLLSDFAIDGLLMMLDGPLPFGDSAAAASHTARTALRTNRLSDIIDHLPTAKLDEVLEGGIAGEKFEIIPYSGQSTPDSWPENRGFLGSSSKMTLMPGTIIDRFGYRSGTFVSPQGTPFVMRALPDSTLLKPFETYRVLKSIEVDGGLIAPAFGKPGLGIQYELPYSINELIELKMIELFTP